MSATRLIARLGVIVAFVATLLSITAPLLGAAFPGAELAFISRNERQPDTDIFIYDVDRGMRINLTRSGAGERAFAWSPDGRQIAFTSDREGRFDLYTMDADGRNGRNLTRGTVSHLNALWPPFWSPDGSHIAFVSTLEAYAYKLHVMRSDGSRLRDISPNPADGLGLPPVWSWSPDGTRLAFISSPTNRDHEFYVADVGSGTLQRLNLGAFDIYALSWSPDGSQIAFETLPVNGKSGIFAIQVGGNELRQLTQDRDYDLIWSPDGSQFSFARLRASDGVADIYVTDAACAETTGDCSSALRNLTRSSETDDRYPVWSPSGRQIAVVSWGWRMRMAYVPIIDVDGSSARGLIRLARNGYAPSGVELTWSPDGSFLAIRASWENHEELYIVDLATGQADLVASNDYSINASAAWRP